MEKKLIIVHPTLRYSMSKELHRKIRELTECFPAEARFFLFSDTSYQSYAGELRRENGRRSDTGEIKDKSFLQEILDSDAITIAGHIGGNCHHTAYEAVVATAWREKRKLSITLQTDAISDAIDHDRYSMRDRIQHLSRREPELPGRLSWIQPADRSPLETTALITMQLYLRQVQRFRMQVLVDKKPVYRPTSFSGINVAIDTASIQ